MSFPIVYAWQTTPYVSFHDNNAGSLFVTLSSNGGCVLGAVKKYKSFTLHGVLMWFAWSFLGVMQIYTSRYSMNYWQIRRKLHVGVGASIGVLTVASLIIVLKELQWAFYFDHWHNVAGMLFGLLCLLLVCGGILALVVKRYLDFNWKTK